MYKATIWMFALLVMVVLAPAAQAQTDMTQNIPYTDTPPVIDGEIDDIYSTEGDGVFPMLNGRSGYPETGPDPTNLTGTTYALWDEEYLYIIAVVVDDILIADNVTGTWQDDSIELYIDGLNEKCQGCYDANDVQYRFRPGIPDGEPPMIYESGTGNGSGFPAPTEEGIIWTTALPEEGGYRIEVALPWEKNSVPAQTNAVIGFDIHINDADEEGETSRQGKLHWSDSEGDNQWQNASLYGTAILVGGGGATEAVAQIRRTPGGGVRAGIEVEFDGSASTAPGTIQTYAWDFGDGTTAEGAVVTHTYTELGEYTVTLTVTDDGGISGTSEAAIKVYSNVGTPELPLEIPMASSAPEIDGVMDDVYASAQTAILGNRANGTEPRDDDDLSVTAYLMWDADNLYVLYDVTDDTLSNDSGNSWEDDTPELYLDGGNDKATTYDDNDLQYELGWGADTPTGNSIGNAEGVIFATTDKDDGTGYLLEVVMPWARASVTPAENLEIGLELMINDDDSGDDVIGGRQTKASWFAPDGIDVAYQDPSAWGTAVLVAELSTAAENPSEIPGAFSIESLYPNPFNPSTTALLNVEQPGEYTVRVYNLLGQVVHKQTLTIQSSGQLSVPFDLRNQASGMYLFSLQNQATGKVATAHAMLLK